MNESFHAILQCPKCGGSFGAAEQELLCLSCNSTYPMERDVPILWGDGKRHSTLENIDYDALQPINMETIRQTVAQWGPLISDVIKEPADVLELGAGTGILTEALTQLPSIRSVIASDVSRKFMLSVKERLVGRPSFRGAVVCDANEPVFSAKAFDLVVGRSVLHHFLDYQLVLQNIRKFLKPGGAAIFFEPVLEGKAIISLACALMLQSSSDNPQIALSTSEAKIIRRVLRHQTKHAWYPQTREELDKLEDKYIFRIGELTKLGLEIGYSDVAVMDLQKSDASYWTYVERTLRMMKVDSKTLEKFNWIAKALEESYLCSTFNVPSPMVYFVFRY